MELKNEAPHPLEDTVDLATKSMRYPSFIAVVKYLYPHARLNSANDHFRKG